MTATDLDPWADPDTEAPEREAAQRPSQFVKMEDLMGRHVMIIPKSIETKQAKDPKPGNETYESITSDVIILDGRKTEKITTLPRIEYDFWITGWNVVAELREHVGKGKPIIGYLTVVKKAYYLDKADADTKKAPSTRAAWDQYKSGNTAKGQAESPPF